MNYVSLHNRSEFSFNAGVPSIPALVSRAKELGMPALALTDTDRMSGLIQFYLECRKNSITPILGVEVTDPCKRTDTVVLLAKNAEGYGDICDIVTRRRLDAKRFSFEQIFSYPFHYRLSRSPSNAGQNAKPFGAVCRTGKQFRSDTSSQQKH